MSEEQVREIDNFALSCFRQCPKFFYWRIEKGLVKPSERKTAAEFGAAIHKALEVYYSSGMNEEARVKSIEAFASSFKEDYADKKRTVGKGLEILARYFEHYASEPFGVVATEVGGAFELGDGWVYRTRLDLIVEWPYPKGIYVYEHKTTSDIGRLVVKPNNQITGYIANLVEMYENVLGATMNIIGVYDSDEVIDKNAPKVASERTGKPVYQKRKREIFARPTTSRTPKEIEEWKRETLFLLSLIDRCRESKTWPKSTEHCSAYRSKCWYLDLCNSTSEEVVERMIEAGIYQVERWEPYKEEGGDANGEEK